MSAETLAWAVRGEPGLSWFEGGGRAVVAWCPDEVATDRVEWTSAARRLQSRGGLVGGFVGYGAAPKAPCGVAPEGDVWWAHYPGFVSFDRRGAASIVGPPPFRRTAAAALRDIRRAPPPDRPTPTPVRGSTSPVAWAGQVAAIREAIAAGTVYQVNLSHVLRTVSPANPLDAYRLWRRVVRPRHGALVRPQDDVWVLSASPEVLLEVDGGRAWSTPIKGTVRRGDGREADRTARSALEASEKDRAELAMIVDLVRNDLTRISEPPSVRAGRRTLRAHGRVWQASTRVSGMLRPGVDAWDALEALFPAGSITGAPKSTALDVIAGLETSPRGISYGSVGFVTGDRAHFNVAIRTAVVSPSGMATHVGGGITWASDAESEWQETLAKAAPWLALFAANHPIHGTDGQH